MPYVADATRYDRMQYRRSGRSGLSCRSSRSASGRTSAATGRSRRRARSSAARSTSASRTSTSRTTTARRTAPPRRRSAGCWRATWAVPRRADHLDEGRLGHVARPVRRRRLPQVPPREPRPEPARGMGLDYVDIFYSHRRDHDTPLEETMGALDTAVRQGKALYAGISSYSRRQTRRGGRRSRASSARRCSSTSRVQHVQPLDRGRSCSTRASEPASACIAFSPLAQGLLTDRYLTGIPEDSRASRDELALARPRSTSETLGKIRALNEHRASGAASRSRSSRSPGCCATTRVTSALIGASSVEQLETNVAALDRLELLVRRRVRRDRRRLTR